MREGWKTATLGNVLDIQNGYAFDSKKFSDDGDMPLIRIRDLKNGVTSATRYSGKYEAKYVVRAGDLLIGMDGEFACHEWKGGPALLNQRVCRLQDFSSSLLPRFLFYGINKFLKDIENVTTFTTVKHLSARQIKEIEFPIPPIPEQKRIVAILDEAFSGVATAVANTERNLANARELFESYLNLVLGQNGERWVTRTLGDVCEIARGGSPRPIKSFLTDDSSGVNWIKISDATASSKFIHETQQKIRREGVRRSRMVHEGDLLLSNSMSFGRPYIMKTSGCIHDGWLVLSNRSGLYDQEYLYYFLSSPDAYQQFDSRASGSTVRNLNIDLVRTVRVPVPPLDRQREIAANCEELEIEADRLESICRQKRDALVELKQSLLQQAFSGQLTGTPQDEIEAALA